ncbi:MAG: molybdopterin-binding protein [Alphaproteobacteria bacterium]|nr:molybdopterin-binding protein [Alphaproteobacteria bacterium]MBL6937650.1 molybdopterin-binding protein [Alphaproteobacteria bacterium]MBL7098988.1 molybdopterin-binding protein [Alphaproteobacteria bacterium]
MSDTRRNVLVRGSTLLGSLALAGCTDLSNKPWVQNALGEVENLTRVAQRLFAGGHSLAPEYSKADVARMFRANGTLNPGTNDYAMHLANDFKDWVIPVGGLVEKPLKLSLVDLRRMPPRTQITRHDCVEGWSCIGEWTGAPLAPILAMARPKPEARYVMFYCADPMGNGALDAGGHIIPPPYYYESLDLLEATHPQTILAYDLNGKPLPVENGAPIRVRAERQLGYKMPKYVQKIDLVDSFTRIGGGKGGYWEDQGYQWYGGI